MKKEIFQLQKNAIRILLTVMLFLTAGMHQINAQNTETLKVGGSSQIPPEFISDTTFSVTKSINPILSFDATTPYFTEIEIVDQAAILVKKVVINDIRDADNNIVKKEFNLAEVPSGTYYAKGMLTGTLVYYEITLIN